MAAVRPATRKPLTSFSIESIVGRQSPSAKEQVIDDKITSSPTSSRFGFQRPTSGPDDITTAAALLHRAIAASRTPSQPAAAANNVMTSSSVPIGNVGLGGLCGNRGATASGGLWTGPLPTGVVNGPSSDVRAGAAAAAAMAAFYSQSALAWHQTIHNAPDYMRHPFLGLC